MRFIFAAWLLLGTADHTHHSVNPVYRELVESGIAADLDEQLPTPLMQDALSDEDQANRLDELIPASQRERFLRESLVAPQSVRQGQSTEVDFLQQRGKIRRVDFWYVAYGNFAAISTEEFLESLGSQMGDDHQSEVLNDQQLNAKGINIDDDHERLAFAEFGLLKKVQLSGTGRSYWSKTEDSIVAASLIDSRFVHDVERPTVWRPLLRDEAGELQVGAAKPYSGAGGYIKLTRSAAVPRQIFVEGHLAFFEPTDWFRGANLLGAKLPALIQKETRRTRRAITEATRDHAGS